jgi:membrane protease YdiL (CAAX protease family)
VINPRVLPFLLLFNAILYTPLVFGEEFGWRSYLQIRIFIDRPLLAAVITGIVWGVWHYPLLLVGYLFPGYPILGLLVFPISTVLLSIILGWIRLNSGSIWATSLAHTSLNTVGASLTMLLFLGGSNYLFVNFFGILGWVPMGILCLWIVMREQLTLNKKNHKS